MSDERRHDRGPAARRRVPRWRRFLYGRENSYRDAWLVLISAVLLWSAITARHAAVDAKRAGEAANRAAHEAKRASTKATENVAKIQDSRVQTARENCRAQNERHDETIRRLRVLVAENPDPEQRRRARANIRGTIELIDALVPKRDCEQYVRDLVRLR